MASWGDKILFLLIVEDFAYALTIKLQHNAQDYLTDVPGVDGVHKVTDFWLFEICGKIYEVFCDEIIASQKKNEQKKVLTCYSNWIIPYLLDIVSLLQIFWFLVLYSIFDFS